MSTPTNICKVCFNEFDALTIHKTICDKCFNNFSTIYKKTSILDIKTLILYEYNNFFKSLIFKLKGCGDIELSSIFLERQKEFLKIRYHNYYIIHIPSWHKSDEERGFNHLKEIFKFLNLKTIDCLRKKINFKQSDLNSKERKEIKDKLKIINGTQITGKKILIVDDIMTTGSTLKAAVYYVKQFKPQVIEILVLASNCRKNEKYVER